jgi:hypothetical protein
VKIDVLAWQMEAWLSGTKAFLEAIAGASSEAAARDAADELRQRAESEGWEAEEYFAEDDALHEKFQQWLPKLSAYSVVILLQSFVETHLHAYAKRLQRDRHLKLAVADLSGKGITPAKTYIIKVAGVPIANDLAWQELFNLQDIRNIVVHRRGRVGDSEDQQNVVQRLLREYPEDLSLTASRFEGVTHTVDQELIPTFRLCSQFLAEVEAFFQRLCKAAGYQEHFIER